MHGRRAADQRGAVATHWSRITTFNGEDGEWAAKIISMNKNGAVLRIGEKRDVATESRLRDHLVQGISRGERMDFVVQKATELGVKRVIPVLTEWGIGVT